VRPWRAHNDYLNTLADWGVVGLGFIGVVLAILALSAIKSWRVFRRTGGEFGSSGSNRFALLAGGIAAFIAILLHSFIDFNLHVPANALVVVTLMALLSGQLRFVTEGYWRAGGLMIRVILGLLIAGSAGYLAVQAARRAQAERYSHRAREIRTLSEERLKLLETAHAWEPRDGTLAAAVGEHLRQLSWQGAAGYEDLALQAIEWFKRAVELNPYNAASHARLGMCLDWLKRFDEADAPFEKALSLDPAGHRTVGLYGWHLFQKGEIESAIEFLDRAVRLSHGENELAMVYLNRAREELAREKQADN
jgi:tetratricopeptide (TPR) repeat protein